MTGAIAARGGKEGGRAGQEWAPHLPRGGGTGLPGGSSALRLQQAQDLVHLGFELVQPGLALDTDRLGVSDFLPQTDLPVHGLAVCRAGDVGGLLSGLAGVVGGVGRARLDTTR